MLLGAAALVVAAATSGLAHVGVTPAPDGTVAARGEIVISVPNESQRADTTSIAVKLPDNVLEVQIPTVTGWRSVGANEPLSPPVQIGGKVVDTRISTVTWSGGRIRPGRRGEFRLRVRVRAGSARRGLAFPTVQRYSDGTVVRWIGPSGSQHPAGVLRSALPVVRVTPAVPQTPTPAPAATATTATTAATTPGGSVGDDDAGSTGLTVGVIVAAAALLGAGAVALTRSRKKH